MDAHEYICFFFKILIFYVFLVNGFFSNSDQFPIHKVFQFDDRFGSDNIGPLSLCYNHTSMLANFSYPMDPTNGIHSH